MHRLLLGLLTILVLSTPASAQDKLPVRLFVEAEDFDVKSGWRVMPYRDNYYAGTFAITFLSRMACLGAPEQPTKKAVAEKVVNIPYADTYELLARYEQPFQFSVEFTVEVEQSGKVIASFPCGRLTDPKIWGLNGHKRVPMERYAWSGTDNIVLQQPGNVKLAAGPATLRLIAAEQKDGDKERENAARRHHVFRLAFSGALKILTRTLDVTLREGNAPAHDRVPRRPDRVAADRSERAL